jgi:hypothetical protein
LLRQHKRFDLTASYMLGQSEGLTTYDAA